MENDCRRTTVDVKQLLGSKLTFPGWVNQAGGSAGKESPDSQLQDVLSGGASRISYGSMRGNKEKGENQIADCSISWLGYLDKLWCHLLKRKSAMVMDGN